MAFRSFPSLPRVTLEWEILGSAMLGSSTAPATCVTLSRALHFSEPPQAQSTELLGRLSGCTGVQARGRPPSPPAGTLPSAAVGVTTGVIAEGTKQGGKDGLTINGEDSNTITL